MNGIYWGLTSLALMGRKDALDRQEMIDWVMSCWVEEEGGRQKLFRASIEQSILTGLRVTHRCICSASGTRSTFASYIKRNSDPSDARCPPFS